MQKVNRHRKHISPVRDSVSLVFLRNIGQVIILTMWRVHEQQQTGQNVFKLDKE